MFIVGTCLCLPAIIMVYPLTSMRIQCGPRNRPAAYGGILPENNDILLTVRQGGNPSLRSKARAA